MNYETYNKVDDDKTAYDDKRDEKNMLKTGIAEGEVHFSGVLS